MKNLIHNILYPPKILGFIIFNISTILLIYVFSMHKEETAIAYISYPLSAYSLIIFCIWFYKICEFSNDFIKSTKIYQLYLTYENKIIKISLIFGSCINFIYGIFKLIMGIKYSSPWFITFASYYLLLWFMKLPLILHIRKHDFGQEKTKEYRKLKQTGIILLTLDIVLAGMIVLIIHTNETIVYPGYFIYIVAMYDFYLVITSFINVIKYRKKSSPVIIASKCINLTVAMISMVSLEVAMIYEFGSGDENFKLIMTSITGGGVCLINSLMAIYMIYKSKQTTKLKKGI